MTSRDDAWLHHAADLLLALLLLAVAVAWICHAGEASETQRPTPQHRARN